VTGTSSDRNGPAINAVDALVRNGTTVLSGTRELDVDVTDTGSGVVRVEFFVGGTRIYTDEDGTDGPPDWKWDFDTTMYADGEYSLTVRATDTVGNATNVTYTILIDNASGADVAPPYVEIITPQNGDVVSGAAVSVRARATDNRVVQQIILEISTGGGPIETFASAPNGTNEFTYTINWDTTNGLYPNGSYIVYARATDGVTTTVVSATDIVVENPDPVPPVVQLTSPTMGTSVVDVVDIIAVATDDIAMDRIDFYIDSVFYGSDAIPSGVNEFIVSWNTSTFTNGNHELFVYAYDAFGNSATDPAAPIVVNVNNPVSDVTPPMVMFIPDTPADGTSVDGTITIAVDAYDEVGVQYVNYYVDYILRGTIGGGPPWEYTIDTTALSDGWHTIQADALDAAGNRSTSIEIRVNARGSGGPAITASNVSPCSSGAGTMFTYTATVTDPDGVATVEAVIHQPYGVELPDPDGRIAMAFAGADIYEGFWVSTIDGSFWVDIEAVDALGNVSRLSNIACTGGAAAACAPDGCNANCPAGCTVADDPDCGCTDTNACCGMGCNNTNDNDCPVCNNNGTCDVGEDNVNCPADCPAVTCGDGMCNYTTEDPDNCPGDCNMGWCSYNCRVDYGILNVRGESCEVDGTCNFDGSSVDECTPFPTQQGCANLAEECCCLVNDPPGCV